MGFERRKEAFDTQHLFMENTNHRTAVRVWSGPLSINKITTPSGKEFDLINLPFYYVGILDKILKELTTQTI